MQRNVYGNWLDALADPPEMLLPEIQVIAAIAKTACAAAIDDPQDVNVRKHLFDVLGDVIDPAFVNDDATYPLPVGDLLRETSAWASLVRCRIENARSSKTLKSAALIQYPARDLRQLLSQLIDELGA